MTISRGSLRPAHRGYWYQDIATAYALVLSLVERYRSVIVDRKQVADDRLDDLEIVTASGRRIRRQFKSSQETHRRLASKDFTDVTLDARLVFSGWAKTTVVTARGLVSRPRASGSVLRAHVLASLSWQHVLQLAEGHTRSLRPLAQLTAPRSREAMIASTLLKVYHQKCGVVTSSSSCGAARRIWTPLGI